MNEETHRKCIKDANRKFASLARSIYTSDIFDGAINILKCIYVSNQFFDTYVMFCTIWYHLHNLKNVKKNPWRNVTFSKVAGYPPCFTFFKLYN